LGIDGCISGIGASLDTCISCIDPTSIGDRRIAPARVSACCPAAPSRAHRTTIRAAGARVSAATSSLTSEARWIVW
jgi:hypothetical protein